jgi:hypothetical protein
LPDCSGDARQRVGGGIGKIHDETLGAKIAPELLSEQRLHIGLVIHHKNENAHV